jgi:hypothetical protein
MRIVALAWSLSLCALQCSGATQPDANTLDAVADSTSRDVPVAEDANTPDAIALDTPSTDAIASDASGMPDTAPATYNAVVLADNPVAFWELANASTGSEPDRTGHGHTGTYRGGTPALVDLPNGDRAADFNGVSEYVTVPSSPAFSIPTTQALTWEAWIRPDVLQFPHSSGGYVDYMGKCASYSPTCEWEARMYNLTNAQNRVSRLSAYVFNPGAGLGSGADWQPANGVIQAAHWYHVVAEYQTRSQPAGCSGPQVGGINIWVNGVEWNMSVHLQTGCLSQFGVTPVANNSPLNIGTMAMDTWFQGAIGKVAIYDHLLSTAQITRHYSVMTSATPAGTCGDTCSLGP